MISDDLDDVDLRYLQCERFIPGALTAWGRPRNLFAARMATNLKPGFVARLSPSSLVDVLGGAAHAMPGRVISVKLQLQGELIRMIVSSIVKGYPSICADDAGNLLPALHWYSLLGESKLSLSVIAPAWFWLPLRLQ